MEIGQYPSKMKIAKVIALYKKGEHFRANNYRPISLLSCFNKIFEKILCRRITKFLEINNVIFDYQYGFRKLHSTTLALLEFSDNITRFLDEGKYAISIFIDLTKAFDTVDHEILLYKLNRYGIRGHANNFFRSYLADRKQFTVVNNGCSKLHGIGCGVPQGSVLGPLLFTVYINDMYQAVGRDHIRLFADDTAIFLSDRNLLSLLNFAKSKFNEIYMWCMKNKLTINAEKTEFVVFHAKNKPMPAKLDILDTGTMSIKRVKSFKYLGVIIDEKLNWNDYVDYVCKSLVKYFGIFNQIKHTVTKRLSRQIYFAFIYSKIQYGIELYGSSSQSNMSKLQILQNKLLKLLLKMDRDTPTYVLHAQMKILKVTDVATCKVLTFVNDILCGNCPKSFENYFQIKVTRYSTRQTAQLQVPRCRIPLADRAVRVKGASLWNKMHKNVKEFRYKKCLKKRLIDHYILTYTTAVS